MAAFTRPAAGEWQNFRGARDGLADNQVLATLEDSGGRLWFGTPRGASRFDGARWITERDSLVPPGAGSPVVQAMLEDRAGRLWFGTPSGLASFDGARWARYSAADVLPVDAVSALLEDHRGEIWIGTPGGLVRHDPGIGQWGTLTASGTGLVHSNAWRLLEDRSHRLWIATPEGVSCLDSTRTQWTRYTQDPNALGRDSVLALAEDQDGGIWFGTDRGAFRLKDGAWSRLTADSGLVSDVVIHILATRAGPVWFGGFTGLARYDGKVCRSYPRTSDGQALGQILSLFEDSVGNLWIGTYSAGLYRYDGAGWRNYFSTRTSCAGRGIQNAPFQYTLGSNCLTDLLQDRRGDLWFATADGGVSRHDRRGRWSLHARGANQPISDSVAVMVEDGGGALWFGSATSGLSRLDASRSAWRTFSRTEGVPGDTVLALEKDRRGDLWVGTATGAARWDGAAWTSYLTGGGSLGDGIQVLGILEDGSERVWLRTSEGLFRIPADRSGAQPVTTADGLVSDAVNTLLLGRDGRLWIGTAAGLSMFEGATWTSYTDFGLLTNTGSPDVVVNSLLEDRQGRVWVATDRGAAYLQGGAWTAFEATVLGSSPNIFTEHGLFEDDLGSIWVSTFAGTARFNGDTWRTLDSRGDGLANDQITRMFQDAQGHLWMLSNGGLTEHELDRVAPQTIFLSGPDPLTPSQNANIVFGAAYGEAADVEFTTSWDGGTFTPWSPIVTWTMTGIADGPHSLVVRSREWLRNQDPTEAVYSFEVDATPPSAIVSAPTFGQPVRGVVEVRGTAADARFRRYRLDVRPAGVSEWSGPLVTAVDSSSVPVTGDSTLSQWNTVAVAEGIYELRLAVTDTLGLVGVAQVRVLVDNQPPFADVTAPVRVNALEGGDVYSVLGEVHLYFPPRAFAEDALVSILPLPAAAGVTSASAEPLTPTWDVGWSADLLKPVTLEMSLPSPGTAGQPAPAIFRQGTSGWIRVGGTLDPTGNRLAAAVTEAGGYALLPDQAPPGGSGSLAALAISPRAFAPNGTSARRLAISFTLGRSAATTVTIYNRAGRRVRELAEGTMLGAGANLLFWDGRDGDGRPVDDGVYVVGVQALGETQQKTVAVVR